MIPPFDDNGYLPPGIHQATLDEIEARFGRDPEVRRAEMESLRWLVHLATEAKVERVVINGSFVTDVEEPNDVDCVLLIGPGTLRDSEAYAELEDGLPFLEILLTEQADFEDMIENVFATDRSETAKGTIEVIG